MFRASYPQLADTTQVVYLDPRGHGRSDRGDPSRRTVDAVLKPDTPAMMLEPRRPCRGRTRRNPPRSDSQIFLLPGDRIGVMVFADGAKRGTRWLMPDVSALPRHLLGVPDDVRCSDTPATPRDLERLGGWYRVLGPAPQIQPSS